MRDPRKSSNRHQTNLRYASKKCIFEAMFSIFPLKSTVVLELHSFAITISNMLKTTSRYCYPFSRAQHPTLRISIPFRWKLDTPEFHGFEPRYPHSSCHKLGIPVSSAFPETAAMRCTEMRQVLQTWTGERWDWILSMFKQNKITYQCLSGKSRTTRKSMNVLAEVLKLWFWNLGT